MLVGDRGEHGLDRVELVGAAVAEQLAAAGHDVERVARAQDGRDRGQAETGRRGRGRRRPPARPAASASSALRPRSGAEPECAARPRAVDLDRPRRLAPHDDAVRAVGGAARRPRSTGTRPSRRSGRHGRSSPSATPRRRRAAAPSRRTRPAARRARASRRARARRRPSCRRCPSRRACRRRACSGRWSPCAITVSRWPSSRTRREPVPRRRATQVVGVVGGGARDALDLGRVGQQRRADGGALLGAVDVARRRGDADQRLELARRPAPDLRRRRLHPGVHDAPR